MCMFCVSEENTHPPGLIWLNSEGHISLRVFLKKMGNNCLCRLFLFLNSWGLNFEYEMIKQNTLMINHFLKGFFEEKIKCLSTFLT